MRNPGSRLIQTGPSALPTAGTSWVSRSIGYESTSSIERAVQFSTGRRARASCSGEARLSFSSAGAVATQAGYAPRIWRRPAGLPANRQRLDGWTLSSNRVLRIRASARALAPMVRTPEPWLIGQRLISSHASETTHCRTGFSTRAEVNRSTVRETCAVDPDERRNCRVLRIQADDGTVHYQSESKARCLASAAICTSNTCGVTAIRTSQKPNGVTFGP